MKKHHYNSQNYQGSKSYKKAHDGKVVIQET